MTASVELDRPVVELKGVAAAAGQRGAPELYALHGYMVRRRNPLMDRPSTRVRLAALFLIAGLLAGPVSTHVYWLFGGTWGLYDRSGAREAAATAGVRIIAAVVIVLLVAAILIVLARVGLWQQRYLSDRLIRFFAWALAAVFLLEALAGFTWSRGEPQWWLYAPIALTLALLALVVAGAGEASRLHRPRRMLPLH
jgi:cytochrome bd-type quinol oxidase subunit 2